MGLQGEFANYSSRPAPTAYFTASAANHIMTSPSNVSLSYRDAGVDMDAGDALVEAIKPFAKRTMREGVMGGIGGFGALFEVSKKFKEPVLVSGTDGVGTKLKLAFHLNKHDTVGIDLVAMSVNDILVQGAEPLFFLDYFACGKLDVPTATAVIKGIAAGCEQAGCALIGGETAEMPSMYPEGEYDLAGFAVGAVEKSKLIDGSKIVPGDVVLGLASSGAHSNGFSLVRKIVAKSKLKWSAAAPFDRKRKLGPVVLTPTRIYVKSCLAAIRQTKAIKALTHITGGGFPDNIPRVLPKGLGAHVDLSRVPVLPVFQWLAQAGRVAEPEMLRTFNCGIGMIAVVEPGKADAVAKVLKREGERVVRLGEVVRASKGEPRVTYTGHLTLRH